MHVDSVLPSVPTFESPPAHNSTSLFVCYPWRLFRHGACGYRWATSTFQRFYIHPYLHRQVHTLARGRSYETQITAESDAWADGFLGLAPRPLLRPIEGCLFESTLWTQLTHLLGSRRLRTTSYHPFTNGLVEKFNGQLKAALKVQPEPTCWADSLPLVLLDIRTAFPNRIWTVLQQCWSMVLLYDCQESVSQQRHNNCAQSMLPTWYNSNPPCNDCKQCHPDVQTIAKRTSVMTSSHAHMFLSCPSWRSAETFTAPVRRAMSSSLAFLQALHNWR
jgi:hypothetical protein